MARQHGMRARKLSSRRSHPPSLLTSVERIVRDEKLITRGDVVVCACSGGPDSTALLHALACLAKTMGFGLVAHGVDHGLRAEAHAELELARATARRYGVPFDVTRTNVEPGSNLLARARRARLEALRRAALSAGARLVATGHTADDRAETFLLRLLRGAGPRGLAVLPPKGPLPLESAGDGPTAALWLIRPLLAVRRTEVVAHLERHGLICAEDPSNRDSRFSRVRVRRELLPLMEQLSPGIVAHLCALADMLRLGSGPVGDVETLLDGLGRAQREALERARRLGRSSIKLRVRGGRDVELTFPDAEGVLKPASCKPTTTDQDRPVRMHGSTTKYR